MRHATRLDALTNFDLHLLTVGRCNEPIGVPFDGLWREVLNSDAVDYGGSGVGNAGAAITVPLPQHGRPCRLVVTVPPLGLLVFHGHRGPAS